MAAKMRNHSAIGAGGGYAKPLRFFKVILEDTLESGKLRLPKRFCRIYGKDLRNLNAVTLKVPNTGDVWEVMLTKCGNGEFWFGRGWKEFESFYSIELGDFVVFKWEVEKSQFQVIIMNKTFTEVQYPSKCIVKVEPSDGEDDVPVKIMSDHSRKQKSHLSSCRSSKKTKRSTGEASSSKHGESKGIYDKSGGKLNFSESRAPPQGSDFVSKYPFFQTVIKSGFLSHNQMRLPRSFARSNIDRNCRNQILTLITDGGRSWQAKLSCYSETMKNCMYGGLSTFLKENFVNAGDLCTFELTDKEQMVFRVHIHRTENVCSKRASCSSKMANADDDMHGELDFSTVRPPRPGSEFASKYPFFQATIGKNTLFYKRMNVPRTFVRDNMDAECGHQTVTLETGGGRSWPVKLVIFSNLNQMVRLDVGLKDFLKENNLKEGDFCTFELINRENMVFRVSIYRG